MSQSAAVNTVVEGEGATLEVAFDHAASARALNVRYRLRNTGDQPLAIFDRGNRHAVLTKRLQVGAIAAPTFQTDGADMTLSHIALPLPKPAPTMPPTPLAIRVAPGAETQAEFEFDLPIGDAPKRLRWCLGVAPFNEANFSAPEHAGKVEIWRASFAAVERQRIMCTPWFDVVTGAFAKS